MKTRYLFFACIGFLLTGCNVSSGGTTAHTSDITLSENSITLEQGTSKDLIATLTPSDSIDPITWTSNNTRVAIVVNGNVNALNIGSAIITASSGNKKATCNVTVVKKQKEEDDPPFPNYRKNSVFFDSNVSTDGTGTIDSPYKTLSKLSTVDFSSIDTVYFKRGSSFTGGLTLENLQGSTTKDYLVTSYGEGELPKFDGNGMTGSGVLFVKNCSYITISNLEFYDSDTTEGDKRGVLLVADNDVEESKAYDKVTLDGLYVHNISGIQDAMNAGMSNQSKRTGGIVFGSYNGYGHFDNLTIKNCKIQTVDNVGICSYYKILKPGDKISPYSEDFATYCHNNVVIDHNDISDVGKNAIFLRNAKDSHIQYNVVHDTAYRCYSGNSIVTTFVDNVIVEHNEGYRNRAHVRHVVEDGVEKDYMQDGCMLDADLQSKDTIWQYNYSHDNSFGLFLNCTSYDEEAGIKDKVIVRYNLSVNDLGTKGIVYINYVSDGIEVYNNTIVTSTSTEYIFMTNSGNKTKCHFYNNLVYNRSNTAKISMHRDYTFNNNLFYSENGCSIQNLDSIKDINTNGLYENPELTGPLDTESRTGYDNMYEYSLGQGSPCIGTGVATDALYDYFGHAANNNIGCSSNA